jgi:transposase
MQQIENHHSLEELRQAARKSGNGRTATRVWLIHDAVSGMKRYLICERYGCSTATLSLWIKRYNEQGLAGLQDKPHRGAPCKLQAEQQEAFRKRMIEQPSMAKDGMVRWRVLDVQRVLAEEFGVHYKREENVRRLLHSLGLAHLTTRPSHPSKDVAAGEDFKKNCPFA